jgi:hypothetical protein
MRHACHKGSELSIDTHIVRPDGSQLKKRGPQGRGYSDQFVEMSF